MRRPDYPKLLLLLLPTLASAGPPRDPAALLEKVDVSEPHYGTATFGRPKIEAFNAPDGSVLLVHQARFGGDGDHGPSILKLFGFRNGAGTKVLAQNIDFVTFVEEQGTLRAIRGKSVETLCDSCDGWDAAEPEDVFLVPIVIDTRTLKVAPELGEVERAALSKRLDQRLRRNLDEQRERGNRGYPAFAAAAAGRIATWLAPGAGRDGDESPTSRPGPAATDAARDLAVAIRARDVQGIMTFVDGRGIPCVDSTVSRDQFERQIRTKGTWLHA